MTRESPGDFVSDLLEAMPTPQARMALMSRLAKHAGRTIYLPVQSKADRRIHAAARMLENDMTDADACTAIKDRFGVSVRTAQRDVKAARKMSQKNVAAG